MRESFSEQRPVRREERSAPEGRVPPNSLEAERAVLGGILLENSAMNVVLEIIDDDDFYSEGHAQIFQSMKTLFGRGEPLDTVTIRPDRCFSAIWSATARQK